ncbi:MAG: hypothetical protein ACYC2O_08165 [Microthrixaceae bacterium]
MAVSNGRRVVAGIAMAGAIGVGALGVASISPLGVAGAQDDPSTTEQPSGEATSRPRLGKGEILEEVLDGLVAEGTIDQAQADAVAEAVGARAAELHEQFGGGGGGFDGRRGLAFDAAAEALGLEPDALKEALEGDGTIAQVAEAQGVDLQTVIDALVAAATERIDAALAEGRIDEARATELKDGLTDRISERVNEAGGGRGRGHRGGPGEGPGERPGGEDAPPEQGESGQGESGD